MSCHMPYKASFLRVLKAIQTGLLSMWRNLRLMAFYPFCTTIGEIIPVCRAFLPQSSKTIGSPISIYVCLPASSYTISFPLQPNLIWNHVFLTDMSIWGMSIKLSSLSYPRKGLQSLGQRIGPGLLRSHTVCIAIFSTLLGDQITH